jgi:hypothetical protein
MATVIIIVQVYKNISFNYILYAFHYRIYLLFNDSNYLILTDNYN